MFGLTPRVFNIKPFAQVGILTVLDDTAGIVITGAGIDSDDPEIYDLFDVEYVPRYGELEESWNVVWKGTDTIAGVARFELPVYIEYANQAGDHDNWKGTFVVYGKGTDVKKPVIQYINNIATKVGSTEYVTIYGHNFNDDLLVFLDRPDGTCVSLSGKDLYRTYGAGGEYDTISFIFGKPFVALDSTCTEICGTYAVNLGYGECGANSIEAGSGDFSTAWNNNLYLIRYRFDSENKDLSEQTPGGMMTTVDPKCFYTSDIELVKDNYESDGKTPSSGGVTGTLGSNIYFRIKPGSDCTKMGYYRVKLKYSRNLPKKSGELTLDGVVLSEGDLVWLDKQFDGGNGLWIVQSGEWVGLKSYMDQQLWVTCDCNVPAEVRETPYEGPQLICENIVVELGYLVLLTSQDDPNTNGVWQVTEAGWVHISNTCDLPTSEPLPVDSNIIADLGVHVKDKVTVACDSDVPAEKRYGTQKICNTIVRPGDTVLLTNQSDGANGVWEVTCAEWFQRSDTIPPHSGTTISGDDFVVVQNDIDFCTCEHSGKNIFHIWYYYLNGACYLARATRTVKITCGLKGSLFPSKGVDVTDYRISSDADPDLVKDTRRTAGDPVRETCMEEVENYDADHRVGIKDNRIGCGNELIIAPNGMKICRCNHVYNVDSETAFSSRDRNGFSIVFWQYDASDERWHLYAYIGAGRYDIGMNYYVYHICTNGIAGEEDVDENTDVGYIPETLLTLTEKWQNGTLVGYEEVDRITGVNLNVGDSYILDGLWSIDADGQAVATKQFVISIVGTNSEHTIGYLASPLRIAIHPELYERPNAWVEMPIDVTSPLALSSLQSSSQKPVNSQDAWFVPHGNGKLAEGFGLFDDTWNFKVVDGDTGEISYTHVLNEKTLYSNWSIKCTTTLCAIRTYDETSLLRTKCGCTDKQMTSDCMNNATSTTVVMSSVNPTPDTWGFKFYNEALSKGRLCNIWNSMPH